MFTMKGLEKIVQTKFTSFIEATEKGKYDYWLKENDISDIARIEYQSFRHPSRSNAFKFKILNSIQQLSEQIEALQTETQLEENRLTLIINLGGLRWVTLVISRPLHLTHLQGFYIDSLGYPYPMDAFKTLKKYHIEIQDFSNYVEQSADDFNCGLQTLENAANLNKMLDRVDTLGAEQAFNQLVVTLNRPHNRFYFNSLRYSLAQKILFDTTHGVRDQPWKTQSRLSEIDTETPISESEASSKRLKVNDKMNVNERLELFVSSFLDVFQKNIAACHLIAKGEKLSVDSLKKELKLGATGALFGFVISQSLAGTLPSLVASLRTISNHYYVDKLKAQKITQIFSNANFNTLNLLIAESAARIFASYEAQFMCVTDKAGDTVAMEKLAADAVIRAINYIAGEASITEISVDFITKATILGNSEKYFDPSLKKLRLSIYGTDIQDSYKNKIYTAAIFENVGLLVTAANTVKIYDKVTSAGMEQYGYRLALGWEKTSQGELLDAYKEQYIQITEPSYLPDLQHELQLYHYTLDTRIILSTAEAILSQLICRSEQHGIAVKSTKSILFDLRKPVENFVGRQAKLNEIHQALLAGRTPTIVNAMSALNSDQAAELTSGSQVSVSGLGGIGKTQLALQYAQLYAADYDNNVLWIDCGTRASLSRSFLKLATKLEIATKDQFGEEKNLEEVVEASYEYFSDRKSLFIFDNVDSHEEIESFLPKIMIGNKPHLLLTSRYTNWKNAATLISLEVFTEQESSVFIKQALLIKDHSQDLKIKELNYLLQGLPLALQQAVSYIKVQQNVDTTFGIDNYLEIFKERSQTILAFDFREHTNDPYLKTVYTTWQITLEKIREKGEIGLFAIEILNVMSFIYPENICAMTFSNLFELDKLSLALELLKRYSMLNTGKIAAEYTVHRLVQKVVNLALQQNFQAFKATALRTELVVMHYEKDIDLRFHYIFFLLNTLDHPTLEPYLRKKGSLRKFSEILMVADNKMWTYFFDIIYTRFNKQRYIDFLVEAFLNYRKEASPYYIQIVLDYIEKKKSQGIFSKSEVAKITDDDAQLITHPQYRVKNLSRDASKRSRQLAVVEIILTFKKKLFPEKYAELCSHKRKRNSRSTCRIAIQSRREVKQKKLALYLQKTNQIATFVSTGLFTKNLVSAFIQGDFESVAINAGLLLSSRFLGSISNALLTKGERLTLAESTLLEKELALENKAAISIFFNKDIILAGKKRFLGRALKTAAPFIKRGVTLFFAYLLYEDVEAYLTEDSNRLSSIISNGALVSIDVLEAGIEAAEGLGLLSNIAVITGPIGETAMVLIWLGAEAYEINKGLTALEQQVELSFPEKIIQGLRLFFYMGPSERIELKIENNRLVQTGLNFLKEHRAISRFVFPAANSEDALQERSEVRLDRPFNLTLSESMPDDISEAELFCAEGGITTESILQMGLRNKKTDFYYCKKALGLKYIKDRTGNTTLIALNKGDDEVITVSNTPTKFLVKEGNKRYKGGDGGNLFVIQGNQVSGLLEGGNEIDAINLENFYANSNTSILLDRNEFLCEKKIVILIPRCTTHQHKIKLKKINHIYGRKKQSDIIFITKTINVVDGKEGASETDPDIIYITQESPENLKIILRANTLVEYIDSKLAPQLVTYLIPSNQSGNAQLTFPFQDNLQQRFFFKYSLKNIMAIAIEDYRIQFNFSESTLTNVSNQLFSLVLEDKQYLLNRKNNFSFIPKNSYYVFNEGIELKLLDEKHIYAKANSFSTLEELLNLFSSTAHKLKKSFSIQFEYNQTALIGSEKSEIFTTDCLTESYFIGNGGENIYRLLPLNTTSFSLPEVILYDISTDSTFDGFKDTLDLRAVSKKARLICPSQLLAIKLSPAGDDLILSLTTNSLLDSECQNLGQPWPLVNVRFKKALFSEWYQKVDIFIEEKIAKQIAYSKEHGWFLHDTPLLFEEDKKIIVLTNQDIGKNSELILYKYMGNFTFFHRNKTDLIITNAQDLSVAQHDLYSIIFSESYNRPGMREKILSATLIFLDGSVYLKEYEFQIDTALDFSNLLNQYPVLPNTSVVSPTTQEALKQSLAQPWLVSSIGVGSASYLGSTLGIVTLALSTITLVTGIFFVRRQHHTNENIPVSLAARIAFLMPLLQSIAAEAMLDVSPLFLENAFSVNQCAKAETLIGLIGLCVHEQNVIYWEQTHAAQAVNFESYLINRNPTEPFTYSLKYENRGQWELDLDKIDNVSLTEIYWWLPPKLHQKLRSKNIFIIWQQQIVSTLSHYTSNLLTLHTPMGNLFKTVGLSPDWRTRDDIHFLSRFWLTTQQVLSYSSLTEQGSSLLAGLMEVTLLHPRMHATYAYLTNNSNFSGVKPIIRLLADCLQLGFYNFLYLTRLLEWCFSENEVVWKISLGLHMVHSFYRLTGDLSYWYLGMALFILPYVPVLLESIGIPVTRGLHEVSNKLVQVFIGQSILNRFSEDKNRVEQQNRELLLADMRVKNGRRRLRGLATSSFSFFAENDSVYSTTEAENISPACTKTVG